MAETEKFIVEIEKAKEGKDGKPSIGPVYRNVLAKDGFIPLPQELDSCWDIFCWSVKKFPNNPMLGEREMVRGKAGSYVWFTYQEVYDLVLKIGASICSCGAMQTDLCHVDNDNAPTKLFDGIFSLEPTHLRSTMSDSTPFICGDRCGIYGANCSNWVIAMQACNAYGLYCVPLYDTLGAGAVEYIISHAEISIVFVEENKISEVLKTFPSTEKYLKSKFRFRDFIIAIVSFGKISQQQKKEAGNFGIKMYSWNDFLLLGIDNRFDIPIKNKTDICTIMYTSGTTGDPKGVMISNESILSIIFGVNNHLESMNQEFCETDVYFSFLPLAHIFDRVTEELFISKGAAIGFWHKDIKGLLDDIKELKPTVFCAVPRVLDRIYSGLIEKISSAGVLKHALFNIAYSYKLHNMHKGYKHVEAAPIFDKIIFNKVNEGLGGNLRLVLSGAAPLSHSVETFLRVATCAHVLQGYGLTETCAGSFAAQPDKMAMVGTVGPPLPMVDICLESVPDMGYDALSSTPRGEICIRGKCLFSGYYKCEDLTKEVMIGDWFHTGDIGEWQPDGSMKIIDRKKNIFKLSQGEYVSVEKLESIYSLSPSVDAIWIYGNSYKSFLVAVVNPSLESLKQWAQVNGVIADVNAMCDDPRARNHVLGELTSIGEKEKLKGFEFIKAVHLDPVPFDIERDLLGPTYKKKRAQFLKYYQKVIEDMYMI